MAKLRTRLEHIAEMPSFYLMMNFVYFYYYFVYYSAVVVVVVGMRRRKRLFVHVMRKMMERL